MRCVAGPEMAQPLTRRIFSAHLVPVSFAVLLLCLSDEENIRGVDGFQKVSTETVTCNGTEPCVHTAQQGDSVSSSNHEFRETVDIPITSTKSTGFDMNEPCPTTALLYLGPLPTSIGTQASRQTISYGRSPWMALGPLSKCHIQSIFVSKMMSKATK
jgi:hypothetical protein